MGGRGAVLCCGIPASTHPMPTVPMPSQVMTVPGTTLCGREPQTEVEDLGLPGCCSFWGPVTCLASDKKSDPTELAMAKDRCLLGPHSARTPCGVGGAGQWGVLLPGGTGGTGPAAPGLALLALLALRFLFSPSRSPRPQELGRMVTLSAGFWSHSS